MSENELQSPSERGGAGVAVEAAPASAFADSARGDAARVAEASQGDGAVRGEGAAATRDEAACAAAPASESVSAREQAIPSLGKVPVPVEGRNAAELMDEAMERADYKGVLPRYEGMQELKEWDGRRFVYHFVKRAFDIVFSGCVLAIILIPGAILAVAIRIQSPGNPFYGQVRVGKTHRDGSLSTFRMWKFRSMYQDADERLKDLLDKSDVAGAMFKMRDDPRVTGIGHFIRKHSIDEFPQFLNVFLGNMSVVGPRPPLPREVRLYTSHDLQRLAVKPGITGLWQVTDRNNTDFDGMVALDLEYIEKRSLLLDLKIVLATVGAVFKGEGAS